jgi:hypothetical protein
VRFEVNPIFALRVDDINQQLGEEAVARMKTLEAEQQRLSLMEEKLNTLTGKLESILEQTSLTANQNSTTQRLERMEVVLNSLSEKVDKLCTYISSHPDAVQATSGSPHAAVPAPSSPLSQPLSPFMPSTTLETLSARPPSSESPSSESPGEAAPSQVTRNPAYIVTPPTPQRSRRVGEAPTMSLAPVVPSRNSSTTRAQSQGHGVSSSDGAGTSASTGSQGTGKGQKRKAQGRDTAAPKKRK